MDAMSLGEPTRQIVLSAQKATFLMILVVVLLVLSFAAGYFLVVEGIRQRHFTFRIRWLLVSPM